MFSILAYFTPSGSPILLRNLFSGFLEVCFFSERRKEQRPKLHKHKNGNIKRSR
jgi:hypothetical protein